MSDHISYLVTYRWSTGEQHEAYVRIAESESDLAGNARRQLVGNHLPVHEIVSVLPARVYVAPGDTADVTLPWSEVCMHLGVAGATYRVQITETSAQIIDQSGRPFSTPITYGEAGIRKDDHGLYVERSALPFCRKETPS